MNRPFSPLTQSYFIDASIHAFQRDNRIAHIISPDLPFGVSKKCKNNVSVLQNKARKVLLKLGIQNSPNVIDKKVHAVKKNIFYD